MKPLRNCLIIAACLVCIFLFQGLSYAAPASSLGNDVMGLVKNENAERDVGKSLGKTMHLFMNELPKEASSNQMFGIPQIGLPSMSIGGTEDHLSPIFGMQTPTMDFPPFFGGDAQQAPPVNQDPAQALLGDWEANYGQRVVCFSFQPGGIVFLIIGTNRVNGTYMVQGNQLSWRFATGSTATLTFSIEGEWLSLSDGSRLHRVAGSRANPMPQAPIVQSPNTGGQALEGAWAVSDGRNTLIMLFKNGICGMNCNGQQFYGRYTVQGNHLHVDFQNAKPLDIDFTIEGDTLRFSDGTMLRRQPMPQQGGSPAPPNPSPAAPQYPSQHTQGATPLEGAWAAQLQNGAHIVFVFTGNQYRFLMNGQPTETGTFTLNGNRLEYTITSGQAAGQRGVNTWQINGNTLILTMPNGSSMQFGRSNAQ